MTEGSRGPLFSSTYAALPHKFYAALAPTPVASPTLLALNDELAEVLNLDADELRSDAGVALLAGNRVADGTTPLAMAYAGHQFGNWVPQLGDGRAILLGERTIADGTLREVQLKGAGATPFSRMGDGRAWIGPVLREYLVSEAMAALNIPTTRALAAVATGEDVIREHVYPGAVLTRVASSHLRVGTFQYFAARDDVEALRTLLEFAIMRHDPAAAQADVPALAFLEGVIARQARLVAGWMHVGFIHGVMNTDNASIGGETIDFGPCAFMDRFDPNMVFSSIDQMGRYAYRNQPGIAQWNLAALAQSLLPLLGDTQEEGLSRAQAAIDAFPDLYQAADLAGMRRKLGLRGEADDDITLYGDLLQIMAKVGADFTLTFRALCDLPRESLHTHAYAPHLGDASAFSAWLARWHERRGDIGMSADEMRDINPRIIPRNHRVEEAIAAALRNDLTVFERMNAALKTPFSQGRDADMELEDPPADHECVHQTFCGT